MSASFPMPAHTREPFYSFWGAESGTNTLGDVLVNQTSDGVDLNEVWAEFATTLELHNQQRTALAALISYQTTRKIDAVPQAVAGAQFEIASEFGVPQGHRIPKDVLKLAYGYEDYDIASRFTWKYLRDADSRQVGAVHNSILEGANRATTTAVLERLFDPTQSQSTEGNTIYGLYNGDGMFIPPYLAPSSILTPIPTTSRQGRPFSTRLMSKLSSPRSAARDSVRRAAVSCSSSPTRSKRR